MKKILLHISAITIVLSLISAGNLQAQKVGDPAPDFSLQTIDGETFKLSEHKGKVVFIFLFGNNCPHCLANAPNTQSIYEKFMSNPDFVALGVDVWNGSNSSVQSFINRTGLKYSIAVNGASLTSQYSSTYDRILIVDKEGNLHYKATSNATAGVSATATEKLNDLLKGGATGVDNTEISENSFKVYPNPVNDLATIQTPFQSGTIVELSLVDLTGKTKMTSTTDISSSGEMNFDVSSYTSGLYFLRIRKGNDVYISKILVE